MARLTIRIDLENETAIGPGKAHLLELVEQRGSIRGAAAAMGMSYRRAWLLLRDIESALGAPVVVGQTGGSRGGGASLTMLGKTVLKRYRTAEKKASRAVRSELRAISGLVKT